MHYSSANQLEKSFLPTLQISIVQSRVNRKEILAYSIYPQVKRGQFYSSHGNLLLLLILCEVPSILAASCISVSKNANNV